MDNILVISPHPDDETLGCGGVLTRHKFEGDSVYWAIFTEISQKAGWSHVDVKQRNDEINTVKKKYAIKKVFNLGYPTTKIDSVPMSDIIKKVTTIASVIPNIPNRLPCLEVSGEASPLKASINKVPDIK